MMSSSSSKPSSSGAKSARCAANLEQLASLLESQYRRDKIESRKRPMRTSNTPQESRKRPLDLRIGIQSRKNPVGRDNRNTSQESRLKIESQKRPVETPNTPEHPRIEAQSRKHPVVRDTPSSSQGRQVPVLDHEHQQHHLDSNFPCQMCPKKYGSIQALGGHQNAHRRDKLLQKRLAKAIQDRVHQNYLNAAGLKKFRCNDPSHRSYHQHHHGVDNHVNLGSRGSGGGGDQGVINGRDDDDDDETSSDDTIYDPTPRRASHPSVYQPVGTTRPRSADQGSNNNNNNNNQPSYGIFLSPKTITTTTTTINLDDDAVQPGVWGPQISRPPPPPPAAPSSSRRRPPVIRQSSIFNNHQICSSGKLFSGRVPKPAAIDLNVSYAQRLRDQLPFPPGFGFDDLNAIYLKKAMGVDEADATWKLDLNLKL